MSLGLSSVYEGEVHDDTVSMDDNLLVLVEYTMTNRNGLIRFASRNVLL